ncbi:hypothetical protein NP493_208g04001 [Ridgeia piscesae]|uniref:INO80 complex subunit F domain-containing protein n=1 Tax=Ridgeia piscesae TaxID=27915 RepID=A0AAD9UEB2_RIDPI|nr:hypothetical protein NP493_208g04001 [Ridgeia piscesae]
MAAAKMPESEEMTTSTPEEPPPSSNDVMTLHDLHQRKYFALKQKCEQMQQMNEKLVNRIHQVKKILKRYNKERRFLTRKLDEHGDNFREIKVPAMWEEGEILRKQACPPPLVPQATTEMPSSSSAHSHGGWGQSEDGRSEDGDLSTSEKLTNAFFMFSQQRTPVIKEQFFKDQRCEMDERKLVQRLTQEWNELTPDMRMAYSDLYEQDIMKPKIEPDDNDEST